MSAPSRIWFRLFLCAAFLTSLYGGMGLLTALMFSNGHSIVAVASAITLSGMAAMTIPLAGITWEMTTPEGELDRRVHTSTGLTDDEAPGQGRTPDYRLKPNQA